MSKTTIEFSDPAAEELARISKASSTTKADVVRNALALYAFLVNELKGPRYNLAILRDDQIEKIVAVPGVYRNMVHTAQAGV